MAPASLLANWAAEIERFAPSLSAMIAHPSVLPADELKTRRPGSLMNTDLVITSYGSLLRLPWIADIPWQLAILDEAQAIKNPAAKQTRAVKQLKATSRIALTGTPIENRLWRPVVDLRLPQPGAAGLGQAIHGSSPSGWPSASTTPTGRCASLVQPYILRRLKTDKSIIADLPDKTEIQAFCR